MASPQLVKCCTTSLDQKLDVRLVGNIGKSPLKEKKLKVIRFL